VGLPGGGAARPVGDLDRAIAHAIVLSRFRLSGRESGVGLYPHR
jgi:hypothetical protein